MKSSILCVVVILVCTVVLAAEPGQAAAGPGPGFSKLDSQLSGMVARAENGRANSQAIAAEAPFSNQDRVAVTVYCSRGREDLRTFLLRRRARVANVGVGFLEAYVPLTELVELSERPEVLSVRTIIPPVALGASPAPTIHGSGDWNTEGLSGLGIKVGVIDTGFTGYGDLIGTELVVPAAVRCYTSVGTFTADLADCEAGGDAHGAAVAEAVIDIAPDASLYLAQPRSPGDLLTTVQWMADQGVQVINHSVAWIWMGPGDGTSPQPDNPLIAVETAVSAGLVWINAAGNHADKTWTGSYLDENNDGFLEFAPGDDENGVLLRKEKTVRLQARWDDVWGGASRDLDLLLFNASGTLVAKSDDAQDGTAGALPFETFSYTPPADGVFFLVLRHFGGAAPSRIQVQTLGGPIVMERTVPDASIANPAESMNPGLLAVGAASWETPTEIEAFSSRGPTADGRVKPDVVGVDQTDSSALGGPFAGTSQASPHVAGLAALVREALPSLSPLEVADYLRSQAIPGGSPVPDNAWGYGLAHLPSLQVLTVAKAGSGSGSVSSDLSGIVCDPDCSAVYPGGTTVTLTATSDSGSSFKGWSGACTGTAICVVTMDADRSVTATFASALADLSLDLIDAPSGRFAPGSRLVIHNIVESIGGLASSGYRITFYASTNTIISTLDRSLGFVDRAGLAPGGMHDFNTRVVLPSGLSDGTYYIGAILTISDASTSNNANFDTTPITVTSMSLVFADGFESGDHSEWSGR